MTDLARRLAACFRDLDDLRSRSPSDAAQLYEAVASHLRSSAPMSLTGIPVVSPLPTVTCPLADESQYSLSIEANCLVVRWEDEESKTLSTLTDVEAYRLTANIEAVLRSRT
jgi:hypothetical protein